MAALRKWCCMVNLMNCWFSNLGLPLSGHIVEVTDRLIQVTAKAGSTVITVILPSVWLEECE